mgnify:FL=1
MRQSGIKILFKLLRERGLRNSIKYSYSRYRYFLKYRIPLAKIMTPAELNIKHPYANNYEPVNHYSFFRMMKSLNRDWRDNSFIDFGCGKGSAILLAEKYNFKSYIGVELAPSLVQEAKANLAKVDVKLARRTEIVQADASLFPIPAEVDVFYFFNPFQRPVMQAVVQSIKNSLQAYPRPIFILYFNAVDLDLFVSAGFKICYAQEEDAISAYACGNYALTN